MVGRPGLTDAEVADIQQAIVDTGALDDLEATIRSRTDEALAALDDAVPQPARDELAALAAFVSVTTSVEPVVVNTPRRSQSAPSEVKSFGATC